MERNDEIDSCGCDSAERNAKRQQREFEPVCSVIIDGYGAIKIPINCRGIALEMDIKRCGALGLPLL